jgi:orotidine-5'-phosphate decarboxylase
VTIKVNSILRACGCDLADEIHTMGLGVFADLKLYDIDKTLEIDGDFLREAKVEMVTVACPTGMGSMRALKSMLPQTEVLGVTVLTTITDDEAGGMFSHSTVLGNVEMFARRASRSNCDGIVCAATEAGCARGSIESYMAIVTPAIRPTWAIVPGDDQNPERIMTPAKAIAAGADYIVVGRPITQAKNPYDAVMRTIEEIASAVS